MVGTADGERHTGGTDVHMLMSTGGVEAGAMTATTVVNLKGHRDDPAYADVVYVGRAMHRGGWHLQPSPLASPYRPGPDGSRAEVVEKYRTYLLSRPDLLALLPGLRGRRLGCWCVPERCHAEVIAELADSPPSSLRPHS
ncbi:MAG TPA: DUF4326 domain-containing protein [Micromonosporaceae bacterium]